MGDRDAERLIDAWLDGDLTPPEQAEVRALLEQDGALRERYGPMIAWLTSGEAIAAPAGLRDRIVAAVHDRARRERRAALTAGPAGRLRWPNRLAWLSAMAASIALFMAGWFGSQYWMQGDRAGVAPAAAEGAPGGAVSPWLLAGYAQSLTAGGVAHPAPFVLQAVAIEMLTEGRTGSPAAGTRGAARSAASAPTARPLKPRPAEPPRGPDEPAPVPLFPIIQRL